ncbi:MAG TPA: ComEC/Rec2 family competence protein [Solirubrobacteraceae bacterium]|nr:ComEC/Rec2 family competence protein [Solirubrobacteraceae bacterium]
MRWLATLGDHPRHVVLFAATAGLLVGPLSRPATVAIAAALGLAAASPLARAVGAASPIARPARGLLVAAAAALLAGALVADLRISALEHGRLPGLHGRSVAARAVLLEPVRVRLGGLATARARLLDGFAPGEGAVLRVRAAAHPGAWPRVGEIVAVSGRVAPLGRFDAFQRRRGALAAIEVSKFRSTGERRGGLPGAVDSARRRAETGLARGLAEPEAALLRGMVLGQDEQLGDDVRDDFKRSGLAHVLAVSGQNVMLLATLVLGAGALFGIPLRARLVVALALVALYVPLTGAGPSIQRAGVMGAAGLVAALAGRPTHRWYALGLAAAITLAINPRAAGEPGWQLSFAAVVSLLALVPALRVWLARGLPGPVADVAAMTVAATVGTAPLMALHFGQVSLAALPANLLAAPAIALIMWLGMLGAGAAQLAPALAAPFNELNQPLLAFVEWVARTMAAVPAAVMPVRIGSPSALALAYGILAASAAGFRALVARLPPARGRRTYEPADGSWLPGGDRPWRFRHHRFGASAAAAALVVLLATASSAHDAPPVLDGDVVVSFLDVGQGDATLIQSGRTSVLVDTGPPGGPIVQRLREAGVERLDGLVLTHAQTDHEGMALEVMRAFPTRLVLDGGAGWPTYVQRGLPAALAGAHARRVDAHAGQVITFGAITMRVLWPPAPGPDFRPAGDPNDRAIVALVESGDFDLFLPADAESNVTAGLPLGPVEALKVAHHGSADDGLPALLERLRPEVAAIEVGRGNTYGHPTPSTLAALRTVDHVFRTDRDGTVRLRVHAGAMTMERAP